MEQERVGRLRMPQPNEIVGKVDEFLGGDKLRVTCSDGKERICRIPGKIRKKLWIRTGDVVLIEPWKVQSDTRADVVWRYTAAQAFWLRKDGIIK
ncbi:MAG: translation initiation factor eIF-1A [Candidatus Aenigmatarchaeota archaeon]